MQVTFRDEVPRGRCAEIVARVARDAPASVELVCDPARPGKAFGAALAGQVLPSVRAFIFDTSWQTVARQATNSLGDLSSVLAACPALERLFFTGDLSLSPAQHDRLQALYLIGDPIRRTALRGLGACRFPALATLAVTVAHERAPAPHVELLAALRALDAPQLAHVTVAGVDATRFLDALGATPLPASWRVLSVVGGIDDEDEILAVLRERAPVLRTLSVLALPLSDGLTEEGLASLDQDLSCLADVEDLPDVLGPKVYEGW